MRKLFFSEYSSCKETSLQAPARSWLPLDRGKLSSKFTAHSGSSSSSIESLMKLPEPPVLPHFKPADYVDVLAGIHEELECCPPDGRSCLYLLQFQVFRGLGEHKLARRSLQAAWDKAATIHDKLVFGAWLKYDKRRERPMSDLLASCGKCSHEFSLLDFVSQVSSAAESSYDDGDDEFQGSPVVHLQIRDDMIACDRCKLAGLSTPLYAMLNGGFRESYLEVIDMSRNGISPVGMRAISKFSLSGRLPYLSPEAILEILDFANKFCCKGLKDACERKLASFVSSRQDAMDFMECAVELGCSVLAASCLQVLLNELPECLNDATQFFWRRRGLPVQHPPSVPPSRCGSRPAVYNFPSGYCFEKDGWWRVYGWLAVLYVYEI